MLGIFLWNFKLSNLIRVNTIKYKFRYDIIIYRGIMINLFFDYLLWPLLMVVAAISFLNSIMENKKSKIIISVILLLAAVVIMMLVYKKFDEGIFIQIYLFLFFLSIALVILALKKQEDRFTLIGIGLMLAMLVILLTFPLE